MERKFQVSEQGTSEQTRGDLKTRSHSASSSQGVSSELKKAARRTVFTPQQLYYLEERFVENQFPDADQRETIAAHLNLTSQHIQVWFQNKRAKARRKLKKMEVHKSKVHVPKPPPFWPQHLPFDSNFTETLQSPDAKADETSEQNISPSSTKISLANFKPSTSIAPTTSISGTSSSPMNSPTSTESVDVFSFINPSSYDAYYERYPPHAPFSHSACSNGAQPKLYSPCGYNVREMSLTNQASNPTTALRDQSAPFRQAPDSTQYSPGSNGRKTDNDSLLLLANCATLATTDSAQRYPSPGITEVSSIGNNVVYNPNTSYRQPQEECQQYNQQATSELCSFNRQVPRMQLSSASEMESHELCLNYPTATQNIQTPMFSDGIYPLQDILSNQEQEWHNTS